MMDCTCEPPFPLSKEGKNITSVLKVMFFIYLALLVGIIIIGNTSVLFMYIIGMIFVLWTALQAGFQIAGIAFFFIILNGFYNFCFLGQRVQNKVMNLPDNFSDDNSLFVAAIVIESFAVIFHCILAFYLFEGYKEFKALLLGSGGGYGKLILHH